MSVRASVARRERPASRRPRLGPLCALGSARGLLPLAVGLGVWQLVGDPASLWFPPPDTWLRAIGDMAAGGELWPAVSRTLLVFVLGLLAGTVVGAAVGAAVGASQRLDRALRPLLELIRSAPPPAIVPVAVLILGASLHAGVVIVMLGVVWPILLNTAAGMRAIPRVRMEASESLGLSGPRTVVKVVMPSLVPSVILGFRIAVAAALVVALLVDIIGSGDGAGLLLMQRRAAFDAAGVWGLLLMIGFFGFLVNAAVALLERRVMRTWGQRA